MLTKPPKVIYNTLKSKIGSPKDYAENLKEALFNSACAKQKTLIPKSCISSALMANGQDTKILEQMVEDADMDMEAVTDDGGDNR